MTVQNPSPESLAHLPQPLAEVITQEVKIHQEVSTSLAAQLAKLDERFRAEDLRSRELTSDLVNTKRLEDKAMLVSDEAVSHAIKSRMGDERQTLRKMIQSPYFARIVVEEELESGDTKNFEYRIGFHANPECRIIDWRKAPLAKLYYNYKEGEEYSEEIQGRERSGRIATRNRLTIERGVLTRISSSQGEVSREAGVWRDITSAGGHRMSSSYSSLPPVLSLITPEQFKAITEDAHSAILIQGVAGSGKTTVALHRLSWLLSQEEKDLLPSDCAILVGSISLKTYLKNSLSSLELDGVKVYTHKEWVLQSLGFSELPRISKELCPSGIERVKRSFALLRTIEQYCTTHRSSLKELLKQQGILAMGREVLRIVLSAPSQQLLALDETRLLDEELLTLTRKRHEELAQHDEVDVTDLWLFLRMQEIVGSGIYLSKEAQLGTGFLGHLIVDEIQDLSPIELAAVLGAVQHLNDVTLVGDVSQQIHRKDFPGWQTLMSAWNMDPESSKYVTLEVSYRSTLPIMALANHIQGKEPPRQGRPGRVPIWFKCAREEQGVGQIIEWLERALVRYPNYLTAVLCRTRQDVHYATSLLKPKFGEAVRLGDEEEFSLEEGIIVAETAQVKGLEFCNVLLWNPSRRVYPKDEIARNLLYVGVTRAEENLAIVTWEAPSIWLPSFNSSLIRGYNLLLPEEEERGEEE